MSDQFQHFLSIENKESERRLLAADLLLLSYLSSLAERKFFEKGNKFQMQSSL